MGFGIRTAVLMSELKSGYRDPQICTVIDKFFIHLFDIVGTLLHILENINEERKYLQKFSEFVISVE